MDNLLSIKPYIYRCDEIECITISDTDYDSDSVVCLDDNDQVNTTKFLNYSAKRMKAEDSNNNIYSPNYQETKTQTPPEEFSPVINSPIYKEAFSPEIKKSKKIRSIEKIDGDLNTLHNNSRNYNKLLVSTILYWELKGNVLKG